MAAGNLKLSVILTAITGAFNDNIRSAGQRFRDAMNGLGSDSKAAGSAIEGNLTLGGLVKSVAAIYSVKEAIKALADNAILVQQVQKQLEFATGGGAQAAAAFALVRDVSNTLGVSLEASAKGFAQLAASTKGTQLEGQATKDLFIGISQAAAVLNLSTEETGGVINALSQIASKGTVQLEELKGQLGDRLPGVLKIAADSMGVTVAELNKMVESGLDANVFLAKFGPALQNAFSAKAAENLATLGGQMNLLKNQFFDLFDTINKAGANNLFAKVIKDINELLASVTQTFKEASASPEFAAFGSQLTSAYETLKEVVGQIVLNIEALYGTFETVLTAAQQLFSTIETGSGASVEALSPLQTAMLGLNVVVGLIADGCKGIAIAIQLTLGGLAQISATVTGTLANAVGVLNKTAGDALMDIAKQRQATMRAAYDQAEKLAQGFKSSTIAALEATGVAAKATAEKAKAATKEQLDAAKNALSELIQTSKEGAKDPLAFQARADAVSAAFTKLGQTGVLNSKEVKEALDKITETLPKALTPLQTFFTELKKGGVDGAQNLYSVSAEAAKTVIALGDLAGSAKTTSFTMREAFTGAISGAKTANEIGLIEKALLDAATRGKLTRADIDEVMAQIGDASRAVGAKIPEDFKTALAKVSNNFGSTVFEVVGRLKSLAAESETSAGAMRSAFDTAIKGAKTATDLRLIEEALQSVSVRAKLTGPDFAATMAQLSDASKGVGVKVTEGVSKAITALAELGKKAETTSDVMKAAFDDAIKGAKTAGDIKLIEDAFKDVGNRSKLTQEDINAVMLAISEKSSKVATDIPKPFEAGLIRVGNSFSGLGQAATKVLDAISKSTQDALDRVGVVTKTMLNAAVEQAKADMEKVRALVNTGELGYEAIAKAQAKIDEATQKATPGIVTMADVTKRLADQNKDAAASADKAAQSYTAAGDAAAHAADTIRLTKDASEGARAGAQALNSQFATLRDELHGISDEAGDEFGRKIGVQFGFVKDSAKGAQDAIGALREANTKLTESSLISGDSGGIYVAMNKLQQAANLTKIELLEARPATDRFAASIDQLGNDGSASFEELKAAADRAGSQIVRFGASSTTGLQTSLDAVKNRIDQIRNASLSTAQALHAMGDSFQLELLRASGDNIAVIQAEAAAQQKQIDDQLQALGVNASAEARAEAARATALLAQITAQKIAAQKASDAAAAADKKKDAADAAANAAADAAPPKVVVPPQAVAPQPPTPTIAANDPTVTGGKVITLRFEDASGKATTVTAPTQQSADDLLAILKRAGATNIAQAGS